MTTRTAGSRNRKTRRAGRYAGPLLVCLLALSTIIVGVAAAGNRPAGAATPGGTTVESQMATQMIQFTNNERAARGFGSLQENAYLDAESQAWVNYAAVNLAGVSPTPDPSNQWEEAWQAANPCTAAYPVCPMNESLVPLGYGAVGSVNSGPAGYGPIGGNVVGLMNSAGHRDTMMTSNYTLAGSGVSCVGGVQIANELFAPAPSNLIINEVPTPATPVVTSPNAGTSCQSSAGPPTLNSGVVGMASNPTGTGYWIASSAGQVTAHGSVVSYGDLTGDVLNAPISHIVSTSDGQGYWLVASDGGTFAFGDAGFFGSMGGKPLNAPVVDLAPTPDDKGYWLVASDGGVFAFGDAAFHGSMGGTHLNAPVNGITSAGGGYRLVANDGGIFSFGAPFYGSTGSIVLNQPIVGMADSPDSLGYWMVARDGGIFAFGDALFHGSMGGQTLAQPMVGMAVDNASGGYWTVAADGGVFAFDATFYGAH